MIQRSIKQTSRTAALIGAAVVFSAASHLHAQVLTNLFGPTPTSDAQASVNVLAVVGGNTASGPVALGANYTGAVTVPVGLVAGLTETVDGTGANSFGTPNALTLTATGVSLNGTFSAVTNLGDASTLLLPNTQYRFTVSRSNGSTVSLLGSVNFTLALGAATPFVNAGTGTGVLGGVGVNVASLLNNNGSANFVFTTPATLLAGSALNFTASGVLGASAGVGNTAQYVLSGASISPVPEPGAMASAIVGLCALTIWRSRRAGRPFGSRD